jgi:valyl-tRNA synthetase
VRWKKVYEHWMENIRDWCISRQLWWGHRIPVWYCQECDETIVSREDPTECTECGSSHLEQDPDVLDTWFSSWLWPFSVFGWPQESEDLKAFYPGHVLSTAPEILFFWVARMIMAGYEFMGGTPFTHVYLHATVRDTQGRKMSKSLGNGIDPLEVVDRFGADALRFTVISAAAVGTDIYLDPDDLEASFAPGRNFANKVWNAGRFALMSLGDDPVQPLEAVEEHLELEDRWILSRLSRAATTVTDELEKFRLHEVADAAYHYFWGDLADWYLELVKSRIHGDAGEESRQAARSTLVTVFDGVLRLLHPMIPFVTEELWQKLPWPEGNGSIGERPSGLIVAPWPTGDPERLDEEAEARMAGLQELITQARRLRKEYHVAEGKGVAVVLDGVSDTLRETVESQSAALLRLARVESVAVEGGGAGGVGAHAVLTDGTEMFIPLEGVIDLERERERLAMEIQRLEGQLAGVQLKLDNGQFVERAPEEVVEREREKARSYGEQLDKLREKLSELSEGA